MFDENVSHLTYNKRTGQVEKVSRDGRLESGGYQRPPKNVPKRLWNEYVHSEKLSPDRAREVVSEYVRRTTPKDFR